MTWSDLMRRAGGLSRQNLLDIRKGRTVPRPDTRRRIEVALELASGGYEQMERGQKPTPADGQPELDNGPAPRTNDLAPLEVVLAGSMADLALLARVHAWRQANLENRDQDRADEDEFMAWAMQVRRERRDGPSSAEADRNAI